MWWTTHVDAESSRRELKISMYRKPLFVVAMLAVGIATIAAGYAGYAYWDRYTRAMAKVAAFSEKTELCLLQLESAAFARDDLPIPHLVKYMELYRRQAGAPSRLESGYDTELRREEMALAKTLGFEVVSDLSADGVLSDASKEKVKTRTAELAADLKLYEDSLSAYLQLMDQLRSDPDVNAVPEAKQAFDTICYGRVLPEFRRQNIMMGN